MSRVRIRRLEPTEPRGLASSRSVVSPWGIGARAAARDRLDLGSRIGLAADLQQSAGNAATAQLLGLVRTDHKTEPPGGVKAIGDAAGSPGNRGLTRSAYTGNPPIFRIGRTEHVGNQWGVKPADVRLPPLDYEVFWPAPGRHRLGPYGKGSQYLDVTPDWSNTLGKGENEHVADTDRAWEMTWGRVAGAINAMAAAPPSTGATVEAAQQAAWQEFKRRLPVGFRPDGDTATTEAQEAKWGADDKGTIFRKMMSETKRVRDGLGWHTPEESLKGMEGDDRVDELSVGNSKIPGTGTDQLLQDAWDRLTKA